MKTALNLICLMLLGTFSLTAYGNTNGWQDEQNSISANPNCIWNPYFPELRQLTIPVSKYEDIFYVRGHILSVETQPKIIFNEEIKGEPTAPSDKSNLAQPEKDQKQVTDNFIVAIGKNVWQGTKDTFGNSYYLAIIGVSFTMDQSIRKWVVERWEQQHGRKDDFDKIINRVEPVGSNPFIAGGLLYGLVFNNKKIIDMSLTTAKATFVSSQVYQVINFTTGRNSPLNTDNAFKFKPFDLNASSIFPSGHVMHISPMVGVFTTYLNNSYVDAAGYTLIGLMSVQRINKNVHWVSDCVVSGFLGYQIGKSFAKYQINNTDATIIPLIAYAPSGNSFIGFNISF